MAPPREEVREEAIHLKSGIWEEYVGDRKRYDERAYENRYGKHSHGEGRNELCVRKGPDGVHEEIK